MVENNIGLTLEQSALAIDVIVDLSAQMAAQNGISNKGIHTTGVVDGAGLAALDVVMSYNSTYQEAQKLGYNQEDAQLAATIAGINAFTANTVGFAVGMFTGEGEGGETGGGGGSGTDAPANGDAPGMPIVLDLNGDGIEIVDQAASNVSMDWDGDGYLEPTAWASSQDGTLVLDLAANGQAGADGKITSVMEVAFARWFAGAKTDLMGLRKAFDTNADNKLDAADERFGEFRIWRDANGNGRTDAGEMKTLGEMGIVSLGRRRNATGEGLKF